MNRICEHNIVELFRALDEAYESDLTRSSDVFFRMTLNAATYYNHVELVTRMLADPSCQLNYLISLTVTTSVKNKIERSRCCLKELKIVEAMLCAGKVRIVHHS